MGDYTYKLDRPHFEVIASYEPGPRWCWSVGEWGHRQGGLWKPYIAQGGAATRWGAMRKARRALRRHKAFLRRRQLSFCTADTQEAER